MKLDILPNIDVKANVDTFGVGTEVGASVSANASSGVDDDASSGGINIDVALATPDLGGGDGKDGPPLVSLDSETDAVINVPVFGEHGLLGSSTEIGGAPNGSHDVGSLLTAAMLNIGCDGGLGAIVSADVYDGNVPLAGDLSSALDSTLDMLTTTSSLFDVPALDILGCDGFDG